MHTSPEPWPSSARGHVDGGKVSHYQVTIKVGFTVKA